jgi:uncharacterized membrane protein
VTQRRASGLEGQHRAFHGGGIDSGESYGEVIDMEESEWPAGHPTAPQLSSLRTWTHAIYALHAFSLLTGIIGAATVVGAFLTGWPSIIAVILNYVKRSETRGTWLESHFRWQIRTFWFGLLWVALCGLFVVVTLGVGLIIAWLPLLLVGLWFIYRIVHGWVRLTAGRPMYA